MNPGFLTQKRQPVPGKAIQSGLKRSGAPEQAVERVDEAAVAAAMAGVAVGRSFKDRDGFDHASAVIVQPEFRGARDFIATAQRCGDSGVGSPAGTAAQNGDAQWIRSV